MSGTPHAGPVAAWSPEWFVPLPEARASLWRGVEAQHMAATMKLIDSLDEQRLLEELLEQSKPPLPVVAAQAAPGAPASHYLLFTPFRYLSPWPSRFRPADAPGIWYGAERLSTACAEVGHWRWRFLVDSDGLRDRQVMTEHTFFQATVTGPVVDLGASPWNALEPAWMHPADYGSCHALAADARRAGVAWIRYRSVRDPAHAPCGAVLRLEAMTLDDLTRQQTWACKATATRVLMRPLNRSSTMEPVEFVFGD